MKIDAEYIYSNDIAYNYLVMYFLPELSDPYFRQENKTFIDQNERYAYSYCMASWLPYERHYEEIIPMLADTLET